MTHDPKGAWTLTLNICMYIRTIQPRCLHQLFCCLFLSLLIVGSGPRPHHFFTSLCFAVCVKAAAARLQEANRYMYMYIFFLSCISPHLQMCCRSAFLSCRLPEEVWRGLRLVSSGYFQLPDGGQLSGPAYPSSRMKSETWDSWNEFLESEQISFLNNDNIPEVSFYSIQPLTETVMRPCLHQDLIIMGAPGTSYWTGSVLVFNTSSGGMSVYLDDETGAVSFGSYLGKWCCTNTFLRGLWSVCHSKSASNENYTNSKYMKCGLRCGNSLLHQRGYRM